MPTYRNVTSQVKIGSLNVQGGVRRKIASGEIDNLVRACDIFCIQETWLEESADLTLTGYHCYRSERKKKRAAGRGSGREGGSYYV